MSDPSVAAMPRPPKRRKAWLLLAAGAVLLAGAVGCGGTPKRQDGSTATEAPAPPATAPPTAPVAPSPSPTGTTVYRMGQTAKVGAMTPDDDQQTSATVYRYKPVSAHGQKLGAVDVKACSTGRKAIAVSAAPWVFVFADGTIGGRVRPGVASPEFPFAPRVLEPRTCVRGWITLSLPGGRKPAFVQWAPDIVGIRHADATWRID